MNKHTLTMEAGGREFTLRFTVQVMTEVEEVYGSIEKLQKVMEGDEKPTIAALDLITYMANAGERHEGRKPTFTREWMAKNLSPKQMMKAKIMSQHAMLVGWRREVSEDEDMTIDVVLREVDEKNKKKEAEEAATNRLPAE